MRKLTEEQIYNALDLSNQYKITLSGKEKNEVVARFVKAGLAEEKKYYGVGYSLISKKFFYYSHGKQHYDSPTSVTMNDFLHDECDAIELARKYNDVSL